MLFIYLTLWFDINVSFGIPTGVFVIATPKGLNKKFQDTSVHFSL